MDAPGGVSRGSNVAELELSYPRPDLPTIYFLITLVLLQSFATPPSHRPARRWLHPTFPAGLLPRELFLTCYIHHGILYSLMLCVCALHPSQLFPCVTTRSRPGSGEVTWGSLSLFAFYLVGPSQCDLTNCWGLLQDFLQMFLPFSLSLSYYVTARFWWVEALGNQLFVHSSEQWELGSNWARMFLLDSSLTPLAPGPSYYYLLEAESRGALGGFTCRFGSRVLHDKESKVSTSEALTGFWLSLPWSFLERA